MERRGIYRKGRAGHVRNIGRYRIYKELAKQTKYWRLPVTVLVALIIVFGFSPLAGEQYQTSLLNAEQAVQLEQGDFNAGKKVVLGVVKSFINDCERFKLQDCMNEGKTLLAHFVSETDDIAGMIFSAEHFASRFEEGVARASCRFDLAQAYVNAREANRSVAAFIDHYGDVAAFGKLNASLSKLSAAIEELDEFVDSCN